MTFVGVLWMMLTIRRQLTLIALATVPLSLIVVMVVAPRSQNILRLNKSLGLLNNQVEETYGGHVVVKVSTTKKVIKKYLKRNEKLYHLWSQSTIYFSDHYAFNELYQKSRLRVCCSPWWRKSSEWYDGFRGCQAFLQYTNQFSQPITQIANLMNTIQATVASAERVFEVLDEEEMVDEPSGVPVETDSPYRVSFEHVAFGYSPEKLLMKDFNLNVKPGEMVAIVGPTGAGKTT